MHDGSNERYSSWMPALYPCVCLYLIGLSFVQRKGALKLHAVLDYDSGLPCYAVMTDGKTHEINVAKDTVFPSGSVLVVDRAYVDYEWLFNLDSTGVFFVTRLKSNADIELVEQFLTKQSHDHILSDEDIRMTGFYSSKKYPKRLRIVKVYDKLNDQELVLLTNHLSWTADTISQLYKARWDVEVFFKHLKQLFRLGSKPSLVIQLTPSEYRCGAL